MNIPKFTIISKLLSEPKRKSGSSINNVIRIYFRREKKILDRSLLLDFMIFWLKPWMRRRKTRHTVRSCSGFAL